MTRFRAATRVMIRIPALAVVAVLTVVGAQAQTVVGPTTLTVEDALRAHGDWIATPDRGPVWYPRANPGWTPNRDGRWSWVEPHGWVWIDAAAWGGMLPPNGQWVEINQRWAWVPGSAPGTMLIPVGPGQGGSRSLLAPAQPQLAPMPGVVRPEVRVVPGATPGVGPPPSVGQPGIGQPGYGQPGYGQPGYGQPWMVPPSVIPPAATPRPGTMPPNPSSGVGLQPSRPIPVPQGPPVIVSPAPPWMGPSIQRPDALPPPTRTVTPAPSRPGEVPPQPAPGGYQGGPAPYPWGGVGVVPPQPPQYRSVPVR